MTSTAGEGPEAEARGTGRGRRRARLLALTLVALVVVAGAAGAAYAIWAEQTAVQSTVGNGYLDVEYTSPPPDFAFSCTAGTNTCTPASQTEQMTFENSGSIPLAAYLEWTTADSTHCGYFDVTLQLVGAATPIFSGDLCTLLFDAPQEVSEQIDPGSTVTLDITVEPDATPPPEGVFSASLAMSLDATVSWAQWNLGGWSGVGTPAAFDITVTVPAGNVAPTADLGNSGPVNEGSAATITFTNQFDPSAEDTAAGFRYAYACDGNAAGLPTTYNGVGTTTSASTTCTFYDEGSYSVAGRIFDQHDAYNTYTTTVTVNNVAPTVTPPANQTATAGVAKSFTLGSFSDPGINDDPWTVEVDWGHGAGFESLGTTSTQGAIAAASHTFGVGGTYTVTVRVTDEDGGAGTATFTVTVSAGQSIYYLHNDPTPPVGDTLSQAPLPSNQTAPTATTLYNYDTDRDALPGRLVLRGGNVAGPGGENDSEDDLALFQDWRIDTPASGGPLVLEGPGGTPINVELRLFTAIEGFATGVRGHIVVYLRDCNAPGTNCTLLATADVARNDWQGGSGTWVEEVITFTGIVDTVVPGRWLDIKVIVHSDSGDDMWLAYDTVSYMSRLTWPVA